MRQVGLLAAVILMAVACGGGGGGDRSDDGGPSGGTGALRLGGEEVSEEDFRREMSALIDTPNGQTLCDLVRDMSNGEAGRLFRLGSGLAGTPRTPTPDEELARARGGAIVKELCAENEGAVATPTAG
jgi:hypothetical protein